MFAGQVAFSALFWAATVVALVRCRGAMIARTARVSQGRRALLAVGLLLASIVCLGLGMAVLAHGGLTPDGFTLGGWIAITTAGAGFIALQTVALVPLMLNATRPVTTDDARSSSKVDPER